MDSQLFKIKNLGVIYTPNDTLILTYICKKVILSLILDRITPKLISNNTTNIDMKTVRKLNFSELERLFRIVKEIKILDPSVGTGNFLIEARNLLFDIYSYLIEVKVCNWSLDEIFSWILSNNLYGVDISRYAIEQCKNRLLDLKDYLDDHEILSFQNIDTLNEHLRVGDALVGLSFEENKIEGLKDSNFDWKKEFSEVMSQGGFDCCIGNPPWNILKPLEKEFFAQFDSRLSKYNLDKIESKRIIKHLLTNSKIRYKWKEYKDSIKRKINYFKNYDFQFQSDKMRVAGITKTISGDYNLYKLFLERFYQLTKIDGYCGIIIPSGFHTDAGTKGLRRLIFERNQVKELICFENRAGIFPLIHKSFKFDVLIFKKGKKTREFKTIYMLKNQEDLKNFNKIALRIIWEEMKRFSPSAWSLLELKSLDDIRIVRKLSSFPTLGSEDNEPWKLRFRRELDISLDNHLFNRDKKGVIVYEGKMIEQFNNFFKTPRYWITESNIFSKFDSKYQEFNEFRLIFRAIAASTNRRSMISTIIPPRTCCGNSLIVSRIYDPITQERIISEKDLLFLCGVFNSFIFDYFLRLKITTNLNMFFIYEIPVPRVSKNSYFYTEIIKTVSILLSEEKGLEKLVNQFISKPLSKSEYNRNYYIALLNSYVAKMYNIDLEDFKFILDTFNIKDFKKAKELNSIKSLIIKLFRNI